MNMDAGRRYIMPLIVGPIDREYSARGAHYRGREMLALEFQTGSQAVSALLPECFELAGPRITVAFVDNKGVDFMAGRGYRIATVLVTVRFHGERDRVEGSYALVMFEDDTLPIVLGRELLGVHKIYADISSIRILPNGRLRCEASLWGHMLFGVEVDPPIKQDEAVCAAASERAGKVPLMGYKYIQSFEGTPDAAYPTSTPSDVHFEEVWLGGSGSFFVGDASEADIGVLAGILDALRKLPVNQVTGVTLTRGSTILRSDLSRRLR